jgi:hypothetical protein
MKKTIFAAAVVCLSFVLGVVSASAQMINVVRVTLPVAATIGGVSIPAGECTIQTLQSDGSSSVLLIRGANGAAVETIATRVNDSQSQRETHVTLRPAGSSYQLDKIWIAGQHYGYELLTSK